MCSQNVESFAGQTPPTESTSEVLDSFSKHHNSISTHYFQSIAQDALDFIEELEFAVSCDQLLCLNMFILWSGMHNEKKCKKRISFHHKTFTSSEFVIAQSIFIFAFFLKEIPFADVCTEVRKIHGKVQKALLVDPITDDQIKVGIYFLLPLFGNFFCACT